MSIVNEPKTIDNIDDWRRSYNFTENVNAQQYASCKAYLVTDSTLTYKYEYANPTSSNQITTVPINDYDLSTSNQLFEFSVIYPYFSAIFFYYTYSEVYKIDVLVGVEWGSRYSTVDGSKFLVTEDGYDASDIYSYVVYEGNYPPSGGYYYSYGDLVSFTTMQQRIPSSSPASFCQNGYAIVGVSGYFLDPQTNAKRQFAWGQNETSCANDPNCELAVWKTNTSFYVGSYGNATFPPSSSDPCGTKDGVSTINYLGFTTKEYIAYVQNPNLRTPYPYNEYGYLYQESNIDMQEDVVYTPYEMGCGSDPYDVTNMIDPSLESNQSMTATFLILCWTIALVCTVGKHTIEYQKLYNEEEVSKLEETVENGLRNVLLWNCCCQNFCCCLKCCTKQPKHDEGDDDGQQRGCKGYINKVFSFISHAVLFPVGILAPATPRAADFNCFFIWKGLLDYNLSNGLAITWFVCLGCVLFYVMTFGQCDQSNNSCGLRCIACLRMFFEFLLLGVVIGSMCTLLGIAIFDKVASIGNIATVALTGINFPSLSEVISAINIDNVPVNGPVKYFLGFHITGIIKIAFFLISLLLNLVEAICRKR